MSREVSSRFALAALLTVTLSATAGAANKEHQQMMADIRMLQEQTQLLQAHLVALTEALRTVTAKLDEQAGTSRKAFADQKVLTDTISSDLRVVREKVDDNNVRIGSLSQELEALRMAIPQAPSAPVTPTGGDQPGAPPPAAGNTQPQAPPPVNPGVSPDRLYTMAWADFGAGQYNLAISGFENYIRSFPKSEQAGGAQYYIGESYYQQGMFREAVTAYDRGISDYPNSKMLPDMYYKRGLALNALGQTDRARESWEFVVKTYPNSDAGRLAKQSLERMIRRDDPAGEDDLEP